MQILEDDMLNALPTRIMSLDMKNEAQTGYRSFNHSLIYTEIQTGTEA
jgi:hypothetical protein